MKTLIAAALLAVLAGPSFATPYYQHPVLTPSSVQGELFVVPMWTNAGVVQETLAPAFYHNAAPTAPWYEPSTAFALGWSAGGGAGEYVEFLVNNPSGNYTYTVGAGGAGGVGSTTTGGLGGTGVIIVDEFY